MKHESLCRRVWGPIVVVLLVAWTSTAISQEPPAKPQGQPPGKPTVTKSEAQKKKLRGRLPTYYGQVVNDKQREEIYEIQAKFNEQIEKLKEQLKELVDQRNAEVEQVLTDEQRAEIEQMKSERRAQRNTKSTTDATSDGD